MRTLSPPDHGLLVALTLCTLGTCTCTCTVHVAGTCTMIFGAIDLPVPGTGTATGTRTGTRNARTAAACAMYRYSAGSTVSTVHLPLDCPPSAHSNCYFHRTAVLLDLVLVCVVLYSILARSRYTSIDITGTSGTSGT